MIIFDYATLACDSHRRHFIDPKKMESIKCIVCGDWLRDPFLDMMKCPVCHKTCEGEPPDYASYYAAAQHDKPIEATIKLFESYLVPCLSGVGDVEIWIDLPYEYQHKIEIWLENHIISERTDYKLKMRPDGDTTPWHELKKKWLDDTYEDTKWGRKSPIEMAFETAGSPMIDTWKKYGVPCMEVHV